MINPDDLNEEHRAFFDDKFVGVYCDRCCEGIWDRKGVSFGHDAFPVTDTLKARLMAWQAVYDEWFDLDIDADGRGEALNLDWEGFTRMGHEIAVDIKRELPDWTVFYYDLHPFKNRHPHIGSREPVYLYEILVDMA